VHKQSINYYKRDLIFQISLVLRPGTEIRKAACIALFYETNKAPNRRLFGCPYRLIPQHFFEQKFPLRFFVCRLIEKMQSWYNKNNHLRKRLLL